MTLAFKYVPEGKAPKSPVRRRVSETKFNRLWNRVLEFCTERGPTGPAQPQPDPLWYYVVDQRYSPFLSPTLEIHSDRAITTRFVEELARLVGQFDDASVGLIVVGPGLIEVFAKRVVVSGECYRRCTTVDQALAVARRAIRITMVLRSCDSDEALRNLARYPELRRTPFHLNLRDKPITDQGLQAIRLLGGVCNLQLCGTRTTDAGLAWLAKLTAIEDLGLHGTVTDAGLAHLAPLSSLIHLDASGPGVRGPGLASLSCTEILTDLNLHTARLDAKSLPLLGRFHHLKRLGLFRAKIGDQGLRHLALLPELTYLTLTGTNITDAGLAHLAALPKVSTLHLKDTLITDAGLAHLSQMPALDSLDVAGTNVTWKGLEQLANENPKLDTFEVSSGFLTPRLAKRWRAEPGATLVFASRIRAE